MRNIIYILLISVFILAACAPKTFTEKDLANVKLTEKDLPAGFVQSPDSAVENLTPYTTSLQKAFFKEVSTGKIINTTMFSKDASDASHGIISFEYFLLSEAEKQQVLTETKKQDLATCCKMIVSILQGDDTSCTQPDFTSMLKVVSSLNKIADASLGCTLAIAGDSFFELGYAVNQNVISVIFEGFNQFNPDDKITPLLDLKTMLTLMNGKLSTAAK
jgi:hypothetical protein